MVDQCRFDTFSIINNFNLSTKIFNSSIFKWNNKTATDLIWHPWLADRGSLKRNHGDQDVVSKLVEKSPKLRIFPGRNKIQTQFL